MNKFILDRKLLHGRDICYNTILHYDDKLPEVKVSQDIEIITVIDKHSLGNSSLLKSNIVNNKVKTIVVDVYVKWRSKIEEVLNYLVENYNDIPNYVLYMDGTDTLIINDVDNPKKLLDFYDCKLLFNSEPDFWHTGAEAPKDYPNYYLPLYEKIKDEYLEKSQNKYNLEKYHQHSLNAGVFLGEKDYVIEVLKEVLRYMTDNYSEGFPHGCDDDQCILKFIHNKYFENISIDLFNIIMFWGTPKSITDTEGQFSVEWVKNSKIKYTKTKFKNGFNY